MKKIMIKIIQFYQNYISHLLGEFKCKFYPTCSEYAIQALEKYGIWKGLALSIKRIMKCNPFSKGGYDPLK